MNEEYYGQHSSTTTGAPLKTFSKLHQKSNLLRTYIRLASAAKTDNEFRKIIISLEDRLAPSEWKEILSYLAQKQKLQVGIRGVLRQGLSRILGQSPPSVMNNVEIELLAQGRITHKDGNEIAVTRYIRGLNTRGLSHFLHPENTTKSLLIIWTGALRRPMMPLHTFLQEVWNLNIDVLVLRSAPNSRDYLNGVVGLGNTLGKAIDGLHEFRVRHGYGSVYLIGSSMGTPPALFSAAKLQTDNCLLVGPLDPRPKYKDHFDHLVRSQENEKNSLRFSTVVGEHATQDAPISNLLSNTFGSLEIVVPGAEHNALWPITERGELADWLDNNCFYGATRAALKESYPR